MSITQKFILIFTPHLLLFGCSGDPTFYMGQWAINTEELKESIDKEYASRSEEAVALKDELKEAHADDGWQFKSDGTYSHSGLYPSEGTYTLYSDGADWVILRLKPQDDSRSDNEKINAMTVEQLIDYEGVFNGPAPSLIGFLKLPDKQIKGFQVLVEKGKLTDTREYIAIYDAVKTEER